MAVANSDYVPDPFPGIHLPDGTGAAGTSPDRTPPGDGGVPASSSGLPGVGTEMPLSFQAGLGSSASTVQPGQNAASIIAPGPSADYVDTGAGQGHTDPWPRENWQQEPGED